MQANPRLFLPTGEYERGCGALPRHTFSDPLVGAGIRFNFARRLKAQYEHPST